ncbi:hypothetical protein JOF29_007111 [Kribbella aluminosa]|uniref:Uncharacterized protein n=1 Tax=Kribbella aluminosa TaxID=416017 RepID=A0ABS4UWJ9_9ACTN|nr:hypothetical protein [Kribbella aluminosa]MBP2356001.1 hypothetical protein [Kribbella aluminosa]
MTTTTVAVMRGAVPGEGGDAAGEGGPGCRGGDCDEQQDGGRSGGVGGEDSEQSGVAGGGLGLGDDGEQDPGGA